MRKQFQIFIIRWILNSFALWVAVRLLSTGDFADNSGGMITYLFAGLILSFINTLIKPIVVILSLPAILLTLGLFMLIVNGLMVYLALALVPSFEITFFGAVLAGMILSLTNYLLSGILELRKQPKGI
ncbi:phage holin family protein [Pedobacter sp.]|nr:phage holin family protein [Candidatus Saccharibacteria bacterium]